jgi:hypothetical protein
MACYWEDLKEIRDNPDSTVLEVWISNIIIKANTSGNHGPLIDLMARMFGTPRASIEVNAKIEVVKQEIILPDGSKINI